MGEVIVQIYVFSLSQAYMRPKLQSLPLRLLRSLYLHNKGGPSQGFSRNYYCGWSGVPWIF